MALRATKTIQITYLLEKLQRLSYSKEMRYEHMRRKRELSKGDIHRESVL